MKVITFDSTEMCYQKQLLKLEYEVIIDYYILEYLRTE